MYRSKNKVEGDTSIMTYKGHVVRKTLIRSRFSPLHTTGQRYIYTGCGVGRVISKSLFHTLIRSNFAINFVVYDVLTGKIKRILTGHNACVRDVAWHPYKNEIMSSSVSTIF